MGKYSFPQMNNNDSTNKKMSALECSRTGTSPEDETTFSFNTQVGFNLFCLVYLAPLNVSWNYNNNALCAETLTFYCTPVQRRIYNWYVDNHN